MYDVCSVRVVVLRRTHNTCHGAHFHDKINLRQHNIIYIYI